MSNDGELCKDRLHDNGLYNEHAIRLYDDGRQHNDESYDNNGYADREPNDGGLCYGSQDNDLYDGDRYHNGRPFNNVGTIVGGFNNEGTIVRPHNVTGSNNRGLQPNKMSADNVRLSNRGSNDDNGKLNNDSVLYVDKRLDSSQSDDDGSNDVNGSPRDVILNVNEGLHDEGSCWQKSRE